MPSHDPEGIFTSHGGHARPATRIDFPANLTHTGQVTVHITKWQMMTTEEKGAYVNLSYSAIDSIQKMFILIIRNVS